MSLPRFASVAPLFYKDYTIKTLEIKGDYEIWAKDIEEYFAVSGFPQHFDAIKDYQEPELEHDLQFEVEEGIAVGTTQL